jgi:hypothetical protein
VEMEEEEIVAVLPGSSARRPPRVIVMHGREVLSRLVPTGFDSGTPVLPRAVESVLPYLVVPDGAGWLRFPRRTPLGWIMACRTEPSSRGAVQVLLKASQVAGHGMWALKSPHDVTPSDLAWLPLTALQEALAAPEHRWLRLHVDAVVAYLTSAAAQSCGPIDPPLGEMLLVPPRRRDEHLRFRHAHGNADRARRSDWVYDITDVSVLLRLLVAKNMVGHVESAHSTWDWCVGMQLAPSLPQSMHDFPVASPHLLSFLLPIVGPLFCPSSSQCDRCGVH